MVSSVPAMSMVTVCVIWQLPEASTRQSVFISVMTVASAANAGTQSASAHKTARSSVISRFVFSTSLRSVMISGVFLNKIPQNARNCNRSAQTRRENRRSGTARCISVKNTKLSGVFWLESPLISIRKYDMIVLETAPDGSGQHGRRAAKN